MGGYRRRDYRHQSKAASVGGLCAFGSRQSTKLGEGILRIPTSLANQRAFIDIKFSENVPGGPCGRNDRIRLLLIDNIW
jgi:hypothetical protein